MTVVAVFTIADSVYKLRELNVFCIAVWNVQTKNAKSRPQTTGADGGSTGSSPITHWRCSQCRRRPSSSRRRAAIWQLPGFVARRGALAREPVRTLLRLHRDFLDYAAPLRDIAEGAL